MALGHSPAGWAAGEFVLAARGFGDAAQQFLFSPSKELQSTELCVSHSCSSVVLLQIPSPWEILLVSPLHVHELLSLLVDAKMGTEERSDIPDPKLVTNSISCRSPGLCVGPRLQFKEMVGDYLYAQ